MARCRVRRSKRSSRNTPEHFLSDVLSYSALTEQACALWPQAITPGALHVVSTPIGNLGDITLRALAVLRQASVICCEATRHARPLLDRYGIGTPTQALHEHNEASAVPRLL